MLLIFLALECNVKTYVLSCLAPGFVCVLNLGFIPNSTFMRDSVLSNPYSA